MPAGNRSAGDPPVTPADGSRGDRGTDPAADPIAQLLAGTYVDAETGERLGAAARAVVIEDSLAGREAELVGALGLGDHLAVVADDDTWAALGERGARALASRSTVQRVVLGRAPHADVETVARLGAALAPGTDAVVAVGSGTLNDLCKMAALARGCPQLVFATAPSMNGYTSLSASITEAGLKRSVRAVTPAGVFFDLGVIARAPARLIRAGLGDSICRPTAQADWLLAHLLLDPPAASAPRADRVASGYRTVPFALLAGDEAALFAEPAALLGGDLAAIRRLVRTLVLSGFGMTICGGSYPASQGEHLISHYVEMRRPPDVPDALHGEQIGVCALAMARLQDHLLATDTPPVLQPTAIDRDDVIRTFGPALGDACWRDFAAKRLDRAHTDELNARLATGWDAMRAQLAAVTLGAARMTDILAGAGAPLTPADLGWPPALFAAAFRHAREIRNRYTFLDFAGDLAR